MSKITDAIANFFAPAPPLSIFDESAGSVTALAVKSNYVPTIQPAGAVVSLPGGAEQQPEFIPYDNAGNMMWLRGNGSKPKHEKPEFTPEELAKAYYCFFMFRAAVRQITKPARAAKLTLREKRNNAWVENDGHPLIQWWRSGPNPEMSGATFTEADIVHHCVYGGHRAEWTPESCAAPDDRDANGKASPGPPRDKAWLTSINPDILLPDVRKNITVRSDGKLTLPSTNEHGTLYRYVHKVTPDYGYPVEIGDVFAHGHYNPERGYSFFGPLAELDGILGLGGALIRFAKQYLYNNGIPSLFFKYTSNFEKGEPREVPKNAKRKFMQEYLAMAALDGTQPNSPRFLPTNVEPSKITPDLNTILPLEWWDIVQAAVHESLGTSAVESLVGLRYAKNTGSGTESHQTSVWKYTVGPYLAEFAQRLGAFLFKRFRLADAERFVNGDIELTWDFSRVPAWVEVQKERQGRIVEGWKIGGPVRVNEFRQALGLEPDATDFGQQYSFQANPRLGASNNNSNNNSNNGSAA